MSEQGYTFGDVGNDPDYLDCIADAEEAWHAARDEYASRVAEWSGISFSDALHVLYSRLPGRP